MVLRDRHYYERALRSIETNSNNTRGKLFATALKGLSDDATPEKQLKATKARAIRLYKDYMGEELAKKVAATLTKEHLKDYEDSLKGAEKPATPHDKALAREEDKDAGAAEQNSILARLFKATRVPVSYTQLTLPTNFLVGVSGGGA